MSEEFEIIVFEHHDPYDGEYVPKEKAVETFIRMCKKYVNPEYILKKETELNIYKMMVCYTDRSGGDKPSMVSLIGMITPDMIISIKNGITNLYILKCEDCDNEIDLEIDSKWLVCADCRNK